jgi:hypothetical protein
MYLVSISNPIFYSCKQNVMYGLLSWLLMNCCYRMSFFSRGNHGKNNRGWVNWNKGPRFSIHFDVDPQELNQLFQVGLFKWIGKGIVQPRPERHPYQPQEIPVNLFLLMCPCNQKSLQMMDGKRLSTRLSHTIMLSFEPLLGFFSIY